MTNTGRWVKEPPPIEQSGRIFWVRKIGACRHCNRAAIRALMFTPAMSGWWVHSLGLWSAERIAEAYERWSEPIEEPPHDEH
jgi:hypothetical protein